MEYVQVPASASILPQSPTLGDGPQPRTKPAPRTQSFPPASSSTAPVQGTSTASKVSGKLSTNVSDLLLSSLLPASLPKLPTPPGRDSENKGRPRELSTQKEALSLPVVSYNFRRFVTRVSNIVRAIVLTVRLARSSGCRIASRRCCIGGSLCGHGLGCLHGLLFVSNDPIRL